MIQSSFPKASKDDIKEALEVFKDPFLLMEILAILEANLILLKLKQLLSPPDAPFIWSEELA